MGVAAPDIYNKPVESISQPPTLLPSYQNVFVIKYRPPTQIFSLSFFPIKLLNAFFISAVHALCCSHPILVLFAPLTMFYENFNNEIPHYSVSQSSHFILSWGQILSLPPFLKQPHDTSLRMRDQFTIDIKNNI
jgi:hypothetical protein